MKLNTKIKDWLRFNFSSKFSRTNISRPSYDKGQFYYNLARQWPTNAPYYPDGNLAGEAIQIWLEKGGMYNENQNEYVIVPGIEIEPVKDWIIYTNYRWKMNPSGYTEHQAKVMEQMLMDYITCCLPVPIVLHRHPMRVHIIRPTFILHIIKNLEFMILQ